MNIFVMMDQREISACVTYDMESESIKHVCICPSQGACVDRKKVLAILVKNLQNIKTSPLIQRTILKIFHMLPHKYLASDKHFDLVSKAFELQQCFGWKILYQDYVNQLWMRAQNSFEKKNLHFVNTQWSKGMVQATLRFSVKMRKERCSALYEKMKIKEIKERQELMVFMVLMAQQEQMVLVGQQALKEIRAMQELMVLMEQLALKEQLV